MNIVKKKEKIEFPKSNLLELINDIIDDISNNNTEFVIKIDTKNLYKIPNRNFYIAYDVTYDSLTYTYFNTNDKTYRFFSLVESYDNTDNTINFLDQKNFVEVLTFFGSSSDNKETLKIDTVKVIKTYDNENIVCETATFVNNILYKLTYQYGHETFYKNNDLFIKQFLFHSFNGNSCKSYDIINNTLIINASFYHKGKNITDDVKNNLEINSENFDENLNITENTLPFYKLKFL